jgi:exopolysaccharide biosynthesis protein
MKRTLIFGAVVVIAVTLAAVSLRGWPRKIADFLTYGYSLPSSMERRTALIDGRKVTFLVLHVPQNMIWGLANDPTSAKSVHEWRATLGATVVINGSYFDGEDHPAGYYVQNSAESVVDCPNFTDSASLAGYTFGVLVKDGHLDLSYIPDDPSFCSDFLSSNRFASFPTLLVHGAPAVAADSGFLARRTILAEGRNGVDIIVTESGELSLFEAARWLDLQADDYAIAGNLDGGPSTGISANAEPWSVEVSSAAVPNVIWGK